MNKKLLLFVWLFSFSECYSADYTPKRGGIILKQQYSSSSQKKNCGPIDPKIEECKARTAKKQLEIAEKMRKQNNNSVKTPIFTIERIEK